jgi:PIN domain nuclease of toxin-antitoxin system
VRLLLDTHALLWFAGSPDTLDPGARQAIVAADEVNVSAASLWEVSTKLAIGKLGADVEDIPGELDEWGFGTMPVTAAHAWAAGSLPLHHRDPFDRMLVAQAQVEGMTIVTRDPQIVRYQVAVLPA